MFTNIDHITIATKDLQAALEVFKKLGGTIILGEPEVIPSQGVHAQMISFNGMPFELIAPLNEESTVAKFIEKRGEGLHHLAFRVDSITDFIANAEKEGIRMIDKEARHGYADSRVAFVHPKSMIGMLTEIVERPAGKDVAPYALPHGGCSSCEG